MSGEIDNFYNQLLKSIMFIYFNDFDDNNTPIRVYLKFLKKAPET